MQSKALGNKVTFRDEAETVMLNDFLLELPTKRKFKDSGQMIAPATIAKVGIMEYRARECGALFADREPDSIVKIMTSAAALYDKEAIESYRSTPITIGHPKENVTVENSKELQMGHLEGIPFQDADGEHLSGTIVLTDIDAIDAVETGKQQLSSGHTCMLVMADAESDWDAEKTEIRANHIAIVSSGRAASAAIADEAKKKEAKKVEVKVFDQAFVDTMQAKLDTAAETIITKDAEIATLNDKTSDASIATLVASRVAFLTSAATLIDTDLVNMSEKEAKLLILKDSLGKDFNDKSDAYINARFDVLLEDGLEDDGNSIAAALVDHAKHDGKVEVKQSADVKARKNMIARNNKSLKGNE